MKSVRRTIQFEMKNKMNVRMKIQVNVIRKIEVKNVIAHLKLLRFNSILKWVVRVKLTVFKSI